MLFLIVLDAIKKKLLKNQFVGRGTFLNGKAKYDIYRKTFSLETESNAGS